MANRAFLEAFGLTPETLHLKKCHELFHDGGQPYPHCPMVRTFENGLPMNTEVSDDRCGRTFDISTFPFLSPDGVIEGTIHIAKNITERKQAEMRLILSDRLAALGEMASGIAHEFNNPLATISGCAEGLQDRLRSGAIEPELLRDYLAIIREEVARCKDITSNMLSFVRKGSGQKRVLELTETIDRTLELVGFQGRLQNVDISRTFHDGPLPILASEAEIKQVLLVLISNALDAVEDRGRIQLATGVENSNAWVRIRDSGPGIRPENMGRIFDPFFSTKAQGTGLGLSIARKIVESLDGTLTLQETGEKGTAFVIRLPLAEESGAEDPHPGRPSEAPNPEISAG
jgi:hypothetical protein